MFENFLELHPDTESSTFRLNDILMFYSKEKVNLSSGYVEIKGFSIKSADKHLIVSKEFNPAIVIDDKVIYRVKVGKHEVFMCGKVAILKWTEPIDKDIYSIDVNTTYIYVAIPKNFVEELIEFLKDRHVELDSEKFDDDSVYFKDGKLFIDNDPYYKISMDIFHSLYNRTTSPSAFIEVLLQLHTKMTQEKNQENKGV